MMTSPYRQLTFVRTRRTINPADPTDMVRWNREPRRKPCVRVTLTSIWDDELRIEVITGWHRWLPTRWRHRAFHLYRGVGTPLARRLRDLLETRYERAMDAREDDPMGNLSDYE